MFLELTSNLYTDCTFHFAVCRAGFSSRAHWRSSSPEWCGDVTVPHWSTVWGHSGTGWTGCRTGGARFWIHRRLHRPWWRWIQNNSQDLEGLLAYRPWAVQISWPQDVSVASIGFVIFLRYFISVYSFRVIRSIKKIKMCCSLCQSLSLI